MIAIYSLVPIIILFLFLLRWLFLSWTPRFPVLLLLTTIRNQTRPKLYWWSGIFIIVLEILLIAIIVLIWVLPDNLRPAIIPIILLNIIQIIRKLLQIRILMQLNSIKHHPRQILITLKHMIPVVSQNKLQCLL